MNIKIKRKRWVIVRDEADVFCGLARHYEFKPVGNIGNTAIKTYLSRNKAIASFESSWDDYDDKRYKAVEVTESVSTSAQGKWMDTGSDNEWFGHFYKCSECGEGMVGLTSYCPSCGVEMLYGGKA